MALNKNDRLGRDTWGDAYDAIPKSVFAYIAWHLANGCSDSCDSEGAAEKRFMEEWDVLLGHGLPHPRGAVKRRMHVLIKRFRAAADPNAAQVESR